MRSILTPKQITDIEKSQTGLQESWKKRPDGGETITYLGKDFVVLPHVYPPGDDSKLLVENMPGMQELSVLDVGTGCGVIAIFAALQGADLVTAVDINPRAVACARINCKKHNVDRYVTVQISDLFDEVKIRRYDIITANLPFQKKYAPDMVAASVWDTDFELHERFFNEVIDFLKPDGVIYMPLMNYPELKQTLELARDAGFRPREIERKLSKGDDPRDYYVFEMTYGQKSIWL